MIRIPGKGFRQRIARRVSTALGEALASAAPPTKMPGLDVHFVIHGNTLSQLNELTNPNKWDNAEWMACHRELEEYSVDKHCFSATKEFAYRKGWEWTQTIFGLKKLGAILPAARALGVGAGHEPLLFYFSDRVAEVVGTDLYGNETWTAEGGKEADATVLKEPQRYCPRSFSADRLRFRTMDGTRLEFEDHAFDFVWSLSSIEHFGGHEQAQESVREMGRVTKPGGIVVVATEVVLTPGAPDHPEYFRPDQFERHVVNATPDLIPIQPMSYQLPDLEYLLDPIMVNLGRDVDRRRHHIVLNDGQTQWTSGLVFFRRR